ncbi:hypothetical protein [Yersinia sp. 2545 StPb PI]|uniref:hypothetical protein n=1 Tax=Yersinia sp. 2545 StPb PI TaxID=3117410 RepID=UPI003FA4A63B
MVNAQADAKKVSVTQGTDGEALARGCLRPEQAHVPEYISTGHHTTKATSGEQHD